MNRRLYGAFGLSLAVSTFLFVGCGQTDKSDQARGKDSQPDSKKDDDHGWWCKEHGMPEAECAQCNAELAAKLKAKGDWCEIHDRPESQCFVCNPKLKEVAARKYRAKFGKEPPPIEDEEKK